MKKLITRVGRRALRPFRPPIVKPQTGGNSFLDAGNQWYHPVLAGASTFAGPSTSPDTVRRVLRVLDQLTPDVYLEHVKGFCTAGLDRYGDQWRYADINTVLVTLAEALRPATYLEIGVRRGRSLAMVASQAPDCRILACDLFIQNYGDMENPGPDFVNAELARVGYRGEIEFVIGDSHVELPRYFAAHPDTWLDMVTVDGDHSDEGARRDIACVLERLKVGGAIIFDDISNQSFPGLAGVWRDMLEANRMYSTFTFDELGFGIGFAIRKA